MALTLFNSLTQKKEEFKPITPGTVGMYNCGPTVYDYAHIGNFRSSIMADILRRVIEYNGLSIDQVMNITDVDDKTIKRSQSEQVPLKEVTKKFEEIFLQDLQSLNVLMPTHMPRATESIEDMIDLINRLLEKKIAYSSADGIYFEISKDPRYGALAQLDTTKIGKERVASDEYDKENPRDFALWKFYTPEDGDVVFDAPFGKGRPGWHIECSAMAMKALGETIDIHTGGIDLLFPHHTNEIAQSENATGKPFVHFWVHGAFITVDGKKMSKSLGNITTLETLREKKIDPIAYRYFVLGAHYRSLLNFTYEALEGSSTALERLVNHFIALGSQSGHVDETYKQKFLNFINDDLDIPQALALLWQLVKDDSISAPDKRATLIDFDRVLGFGLEALTEKLKKDLENIPIPVKNLAAEREIARKAGNFGRADELRAEIHEMGFTVEDAVDGPRILPL